MPVRHTALAVAVAMGFGFSGQVLAQATTGSVFGTAPVSAGETVRVVNSQTGLTREVAVDSTGRYSANQLPTGEYTVSLMQSGNVVATHDHVQVTVSGGTPVAFTAAAASAQNAQNLSTVTVTANSVPAIDVSSTRQTQVITAQQLKTLPIAHTAEAIALLAPGVNSGGSSLGSGPTGAPLVSMGGNSVVEKRLLSQWFQYHRSDRWCGRRYAAVLCHCRAADHHLRLWSRIRSFDRWRDQPDWPAWQQPMACRCVCVHPSVLRRKRLRKHSLQQSADAGGRCW